MAAWERHYGDFEDFIEAHIFAPHPLEGSGTALVEFYDGDSKNPPHAVLECYDRRSAETWAEVLSDWGAYVQVEGTEVYIEPYA
jgi:hypothetical protein